MERLDGKEKWSVVESPRERRSIQTLVQNEAVFVQYLDMGLWHLAFYNDGKDKETVSFSTVVLGGYGAPSCQKRTIRAFSEEMWLLSKTHPFGDRHALFFVMKNYWEPQFGEVLRELSKPRQVRAALHNFSASANLTFIPGQ